MKRNLSYFFAGLSILSMPLTSYSFEVDTQKYFGYYKIPDKFQGGLSIYSPYVFLSQEKCEASGSYTKTAKKGISYWPGAERTRHECWAELNEGVITICPVGQSETESLGNACVDISKSRFIDTYSLPQNADF
ncbi:TPA: hypothetical protein ACXG57_002873 [Escherichia coli]